MPSIRCQPKPIKAIIESLDKIHLLFHCECFISHHANCKCVHREPDEDIRVEIESDFMTHCNLGCVFCQNYTISRLGEGNRISLEMFSRIMIALQKQGCHNINFVSPSHFVPQILQALPRAVEMGLRLPLVYNTGGYDSVETLELLDGVIDIYMPDFKYTGTDVAEKYSQAPDYPRVVEAALKEMHRQAGDLVLDSRGDIPSDSPLARRVTPEEFHEAVRIAKEEGIRRIDSERP